MKFAEMKTADHMFDNWGSVSNPDSNWSLANRYATFSHREACEFIFSLGTDAESFEGNIKGYREAGFSEDVIELMIQAKDQGFNYICLWS